MLQACDRGITPTDECHNVLIRICTATGQCAPSSMAGGEVLCKRVTCVLAWFLECDRNHAERVSAD